jgi:A/G-specific adenine glycosylase
MVAKGVQVRNQIIRWYKRVGRALPWRETADPYAIAVSETMLQQTQVSRVYPKYLAWLKAFPTTKALAKASTQSILKYWSGLGYNSRALRLRAMAQEIERQGTWPKKKEELQKLPGFGPYTAGAVAIFALKTRDFAIDTNIRRVLSRIFFGIKKVPTEQQLEILAASLVPKQGNDAWHHAMMDLGATVCVSRKPKCEVCPVKELCQSYPAILQETPRVRRAGTVVRFIDTDRFWRGRIIAILIDYPILSRSLLAKKLSEYGQIVPERYSRILTDLMSDGLIRIHRGRVMFVR